MAGSIARIPFDKAQIIGSQIKSINRILYMFRGEIEADDGALEIEFCTGTCLFDGTERLHITSGAWVDAFEAPISPENEQYVIEHGKWTRVFCSKEPRYEEMISRKLTGLSWVVDEYGEVVGCGLSAEGSTLWFLAECDECHVLWDKPDGYSFYG